MVSLYAANRRSQLSRLPERNFDEPKRAAVNSLNAGRI